jgi:hypothetical protein
MSHLQVLIVEDQESDFATVASHVRMVCTSRGLIEIAKDDTNVVYASEGTFKIERTDNRRDAETELAKNRGEGALLMMVFDVSVPKAEDLDGLIGAIAEADSSTYIGKRPMIVYTKTNLAELPKPLLRTRKKHVFIIHKYRPRRPGDDPRETLHEKIEICVDLLLAEARDA